MEQATLSVEKRSGTGKSVTRKLRAIGLIPGVVYGRGETMNVSVDPKVIEKILRDEKLRNQLYLLGGTEIPGDKNVLVKDYQVDPVSRKLLHVDLLEVDITKKIQVTVPLNFTGKAVGTANGGVLNFLTREIDVRCLPNRVPTHLDVDVTPLEIGHSLHLDEIQFPEGVEKVSANNETLVACVPPAKEEDATASLAPTAEPEVLTAKKPAEGEAAKTDAKDEKKK